MMRERAFRFGRAQHLIGIAGYPATFGSQVGVIVLNAGLVHRVGPFRLHVDLTRRLNASGYPTLRFDQSTIGDSGSSGESQTKLEQVCADVDDAMTLLREQAGCTSFVLFGLCSGAQNAHSVAIMHEQVAGAVFLDGYAYRTLGYRLRRYAPTLFEWTRWKRLLGGRAPASKSAGSEIMFKPPPSPQAVVRADYAGMVDRGMKLCLIYSGGISMYFNHVRQFRECFGRTMTTPNVTTSFQREVDHTYVLVKDRARLVDRVASWLAQNFPISQAGTSP